MSTTDLEQPIFDTKRIFIDDSDDGTVRVHSKRRWLVEEAIFDTKRIFIDDSDDGTVRVHSKRRKISNNGLEGGWWRKPAEIKLSHDDYTMGWICALPIELAASHAMLDKVHESLPTVDNDTNAYILGSIGGHNIAMACLPSGQYGTNNAATVTGNMMRSFKSIRFGFMVGIGGGVPGDIDVRLGDIVVGTSVVQHDLGKIVEGTGFQGTGTPRIPPQVLLNAVSKLRALHEVKDSQVVVFLREMQERYPKLIEYTFPTSSEDRLFRVTGNHDHGHSGGCSSRSLVKLCHRTSRNDMHPLIHYGGIASGNQVIKCSQRRDELAKEHIVICFEMEAAGLSDALPSIVVRGICDYADSQKNKEWQKYAAATAAAYTKELISTMTPSESISLAQAQTSQLDQFPLALSSRREALLESLRFEQIDARQATIKEAHSKTCEWILSDSAYEQWHDSSLRSHHHGFLWISGKPGAGKSTIMKFAYYRARRNAKKSSAIVSFFFNARGDALEKSTSGLYRSLLLQLLQRFPDLQTVLDDPTLGVTKRISCPSIDETQRLLRNAIAALGQRQLTCFIDALDECDEMQVRDMVVFFEGLGERAAACDVQLKICFSSRHYPHIDIRHGLKMVLEDQPGHGQDLEAYVKSYLRAGNDEYVDEIRSKILTKSGGVFMWVVLVVQLLNAEFVRGRRARVEQRLQEIPAGLSDLFRDILQRDDANMVDLLLCIQWVLFARRPLTLKEFYFAMLSGLPELQDRPRVHDSYYDSDENMRLFVTGSSKGLAEITKSTTETVQFIHESVKDFLIKDNGLRELWPQLGDNFAILSHDRLKFCCLSHLTDEVISQLEAPCIEDLPKANSREAKKMRQRCAEKFPFLTYASQNLFYHANLVAAKSFEDTSWILPLRNWIHLANILEKHQSRRYLSSASLTYILAEKDVANILREHIRRFPMCDVKGERYEFPLFAALANKSWAAANVLLGPAAAAFSGKEPLFPFENYRKHFNSIRVRDSHPLHWAIDTGHDKVAELIISSELYDCFVLDSDKRYPLHWAAIEGNGGLMKQLLEKGFSSTQQNEGRSFLRAPAVPKSSENKHVLERASMHTYLNLPDNSDNTVLSLACRYLREDVVRVLLEFGADFSQDSARITSVESAGTRLSKWLAEFILDKRLLASEKLLEIAIWSGLYDVAELVMDSEDFVLKLGNFDGTKILEGASARDYTILIKSLLERGVTFSNRHWAKRPLYEAASFGDETFIKLLLKNGPLFMVMEQWLNCFLEQTH
ncbi:NACHT and ankyrin domain protein [Colletotrichum asianum]